MESWVQSWRPRTNAFLPFFQSTCLKYCACHEKVMPGHTKCCTCHTKSSQQTWRSDAPKCNPLRKSAAWPPNISDQHVSCTAPAVPHLPSFLEMLQDPHVLLTFARVHNPLHLPRESTSERPYPTFFCTFDFEMCFAPQPRALFRHLNFQKCSEPVSRQFCTLLISKYASRHNGVHFFRHLNFQKCSEREVFFILFTCKCASRHNGVQFFISHLASWLRTRRFSEPTFRPSRATNHWKNSGSRLSYLFGSFRAPGSSLFWDFLFLIFFLLIFSSLLFSSLTLTTSAFHLSILSEVWLLNFLR